LSPRTVEFHKYRIAGKLGVSSTAELTHYAIRHGIVPSNFGAGVP
jgi:DNA-binding CsgD family transcriptional regulator